MQQQIDLARKKTVVLAASLGTNCMLLMILPAMAVRQGIPAVWIVLPLWGLAVVNMVFLLLVARDLLARRHAGGFHGSR